MYPMYKFMDSHPYQKNQVPHNPHYYPHFESNPHPMNIDPTRSSLAYEPWPCAGNYGYPYPPQCHSCCIHNNSPNHFAFRPPYPYFPPPPYSSGSHPAYLGMCPAPYVPPPHFTMEQPRYEYENNMDSGHHCCGCVNHQCNKKGGSSVKIEEQDQDKKNESNESLVHFGFKNSPFPVVWLPPDYMKNGEQMKPNGLKGTKEDEAGSQVVKPYGDFRSLGQPNVWNIWPPYHGHDSESPKQRRDSPGKQRNDDVKDKQFPFPIIWMPYKPEEAGGKVSQEMDSGHSVEQEPTSPSKSTMQRVHDTEDKRSNSRENEVNSGSQSCRKGLNKGPVTKTIPVKQVEQNERVLDEEKDDASQRHTGYAKEQKITQDGGKKQSSSPKKSSKLPPVCLRVDPLPRRKSGNGSSRTPSPPSGKGKIVESSSDSSKPPIVSNEKGNIQLDKSFTTGMPEKSTKVESTKSNTKVIEVAHGASKEDKVQDQRSVFPDMKGQARGQTGEGDTSKAANEPNHQSDRVAAEGESSDEGHQSGDATEAGKGKEDVVDDVKKDRRRELSDDKAATMIQSTYRGLNVRRWEPLKKLKQIAEIKEQMSELKNRTKDLECPADTGVDNKQRTIMTEAIMGLLLKLDAIQGLHPTVREFRKSVAKELVSLQEKLDLLNYKKQPPESEQDFTAKSGEDICSTMENHVPLQGGQEMQKLEQDDDLAKGDQEIKFDAKEPCEKQPLCAIEMLSNSSDVGNADVMADKQENKNIEEVENFSSGNAVETGNGASQVPSESNENSNGKLLGENAVVVEKSEEHGEAELSLPNPIPTANSGSDVRSCGLKEKDEGVNELEELPQGVLDEETNVQTSTEIRDDEVLQSDKSDLTAHVHEVVSDTERLGHHHFEAFGETETPVISGQENMHNSNGQKENAEVIERYAVVTADLPEQEKKDTRPINEEAKISEVDKASIENTAEEHGCSTLLDVSTIQSQEEALTTKQPTNATGTEESETGEVLQENMRNAIEILDPGKTIEPSVEPQPSPVTDNEVRENHVPDNQKVGEENILVLGEELPAGNDALVPEPYNEGKGYNAEVEQKPLEENLEMQVEEPVATDNAAPVTEELVDGNKSMAAPSEAATTGTELLVEKEVDVAEDHSIYPSAEAANCFDSTPTEVQVMDAKEFKEWKREDISPSSPTASQVSFESDALSESDRKLIEENEKLREMMEKLLEAGKEQLTTISSLSGRVKDLEKRLSQKKKKLKLRWVPAAGSACLKPSNDSLKERAMGLAI